MTSAQPASPDTAVQHVHGTGEAVLPTWLWLVLPLFAAALLIVLAQTAPVFYSRYLAPELGILEMLHVVQGATGAVLAVSLLRAPGVLHGRRWLASWVLLALAGCVYVAGEEASWGQHIFAWATPEGWNALNDQGETNIHNVSSWFDQKPRLLLEIGVVAGGIVLPLVQRGGRHLRHGRLAYLVPPITCLPTAAMALLVRLNDAVVEALATKAGLFYRSSEVQELFFYYFVILYLMALRRRLASRPPPP